MKKLILILLAVAPLVSYSQIPGKRTPGPDVLSNGISFKEGDTIILGTGSDPTTAKFLTTRRGPTPAGKPQEASGSSIKPGVYQLTIEDIFTQAMTLRLKRRDLKTYNFYYTSVETPCEIKLRGVLRKLPSGKWRYTSEDKLEIFEVSLATGIPALKVKVIKSTNEECSINVVTGIYKYLGSG